MKKKTLPNRRERSRLLSRLQREVNQVYGKDDEDTPYAFVEVHDYRDGYWPYIRPVPRIPFENPTPEQILASINAAGSNVESTSRALEQVRREVESYFRQVTHEKAVREAVSTVLGKDAIVGKAYDRCDDAPRWSRWESYRIKKNACFYRNDGIGFDIDSFEKWLRAGKRMLIKEYGKLIIGWYVRIGGSIGTSMSALVEIPEKERTAIIARRMAKHDCLEENQKEIEKQATLIERKLRRESRRR
jgi:hypothetical protein